jgi:geranylgeranylglycerol-phosphate geranylgeranyltransferase
MNCVSAGVAAALGAYLSDVPVQLGTVVPAMGVVALTTAFGNAINDVYDVEIDRINMPRRPLVTGVITRPEAIAVVVLSAAGALALSVPLGLAAVALAVVAIGLLWLYSARLKGMFLLGNLVVGALAGLALIYGGLAVGRPLAVLGPALVCSLLVLAREVLKCVEDYEGDLRARLNTIAVVIGREHALRVFSVLTVVAIATVPIYTAATGAPAAPLIGSLGISAVLAAALLVSREPSPRNLRRGVVLTKTSFFLGLIMLFLNQAVR